MSKSPGPYTGLTGTPLIVVNCRSTAFMRAYRYLIHKKSRLQKEPAKWMVRGRSPRIGLDQPRLIRFRKQRLSYTHKFNSCTYGHDSLTPGLLTPPAMGTAVVGTRNSQRP